MTPNGSRRPFLVPPAALALLLAGACGPDEPPPAPPPPKVTVVFPELRDVQQEEVFSGWTDAVESVDIEARVRGHIEKVAFSDGQFVKAGDLLFQLDDRPYRAQVDTLKAQRKVFEAQLVAAGKEAERLAELLGKGGASEKQVEKAQADVAALKAQIESTAAEIQRSQLDVEYCHITSPIDGRTSRAQLTAGNLVEPATGDQVLTSVVSVDPIHVYFDVPESSLMKYRAQVLTEHPDGLGDSVPKETYPFSFGLGIDEGFPREGTLDFSENVIDTGTGTLRLRGVVSNPDGFLVPGARVRVRLPTGQPKQALVVPDRALLADQSLRYVLVAGPDDTVLRRDVHPGRLLDGGLRALAPPPADSEDPGLQPADRVIVEGQARARLHQPVEPLDADGNPAPAKQRGATGDAPPTPEKP